MEYHRLLQRQIKKHFNETQLSDESISDFLKVVNESYLSFEEDKEFLDNVFKIHENEYLDLYNNLNKEYETKKKSIDSLKNSVKHLDLDAVVSFTKDDDDLNIISEYLNQQIHKRKEIEANLTRTLIFLTKLLSNLNSGILIEDENQNILFTNTIFCDLLKIENNSEYITNTNSTEIINKLKDITENPPEFLKQHNEILQNKLAVFADEIKLITGQILKRDYIPIFVNNNYKGHLWDFSDITAKKHYENELISLTNIQNAILNGTDYSIIYADLNGIIKSFNTGAEKMLGYKAEEILSIHTPAIIHDVNEVISKAKELSLELGYNIEPGFDVFVEKSRTGISETNEWTYITKSGERLPVLLTVNTIRNQNNEIIGYLGIARDISEQKKSQAALQLSEERYRTIVEKSTDIIYKTNGFGYFTFINPVAEKLTGYTLNELLGKHFSDLIKPEYKKKSSEYYINQLIQRKSTTYLEFPILTKNGDEIWLGQSVQLTIISRREFEFTALAIDITDKKNYEKTISLQNEKYKNIINNMNLGLSEVDLGGNFQYVNPGFEKLSGFTNAELIGKNPIDFFITDSNKDTLIDKVQNRSKGISDMYEMPIHTKEGETRWWMISGAPNYDYKGKLTGSIGIHLDITEQKKLELALEFAIKKAEEASKAKEAFLANMSHEIRTPLNAIIGMIRELSKDKLTEKQFQYTNNASVASQHLLSVLNNVLDISKIEAGELELDNHHFNLSNLLNDVKSIMITKAGEKGLYLKINHNENSNKIFIGDSVRLRQILLNLVGNSIKFTQNGGVIISYELTNNNSNLEEIKLTVADTGIGMEETFVKNIFNKFSQEDSSTSRKYGGSGLGMSITNELIKLMNGNVCISSAKNVGTTIDIILALPFGDIKNIENVEESIPKNKLENLNILLVEDNKFNRLVACNTLNYYNCKVTEAQNGIEALDILNKNKNFDLILMDLQMPQMDGFEATTQIRKKLLLNIPIIALTANAFKSELELCLKIGMNDYVTKPFEEDVLLNTIAKLVIENRNNASNLIENKIKDKTNLYNLDKIKSIARQDETYINKMIKIFIEQTESATLEIENSYKIKNLENVFRLSHKIKPSIDSMGINILHDNIRYIEKTSKEGLDSDKLEEEISFLLCTLRDVISELKNT